MAIAACADAGVVYQSDFQSGGTAGWSTGATFADDDGKVVLGVFQTAAVSFAFGPLAPGRYDFAFDFYNINSWDGNGAFYLGPDTFSFSLNGAQKVGAAFSNAARIEQTYSPATPFGGGPFLGGTGSSGANELVIHRDLEIPSYRYRFRRVINHTGGAVTFSCLGTITQTGQYNGFLDECWALDNAIIQTHCAADLNGDSFVDDSDFVLFVVGYNILDCADAMMPAECPADLNEDGFADDSDFVLFVGAYNELVCP